MTALFARFRSDPKNPIEFHPAFPLSHSVTLLAGLSCEFLLRRIVADIEDSLQDTKGVDVELGANLAEFTNLGLNGGHGGFVHQLKRNSSGES